jgi:GNAT superfamily N-acetyltransferase
MLGVIELLQREQIGGAALLLARAFANDPILNHFLDDPNKRGDALPAFFEHVLELLLPSRSIYCTIDERGTLTGVAAWRPPDPLEVDDAGAARAEHARLIVDSLFREGARQLFEGFEVLESHHPRSAHWYLTFVGVEPSIQGLGLGTRLLRPVLDDADRTSTPCYLETPFPETSGFYESLGFVCVNHYDFPGAPTGVDAYLRS